MVAELFLGLDGEVEQVKKRRFSFQVPATLLISVEAETQAEAWLQIKQRSNAQFSAVPYGGNEEDWFVCTPVFELAKMFGFECPPGNLEI